MDRFIGLVKLFVVVAGVAIVLGTVALIWLLAGGGGSDAPGGDAAADPSPAAGADLPEVRGDLPVPEGAVVIEMELDGDRALLLLRTVEGGEFLALVDPRSGRRRSLLRLVPEPR